MLSASKVTDKLNTMWLRMMVDYWESKRVMEQAHGEYKIAIEIADEKLKTPKAEIKDKR